MILGPDGIPTAEAAALKTQGQQTQDRNVDRFVEYTTMQGAKAAIGPISSQGMDLLARLTAGFGRHQVSPLGEGTSGRHASQVAEPFPGQRQTLDSDADATSLKGSAPSGEQDKHDGRTVQAAGLYATGNALGG